MLFGKTSSDTARTLTKNVSGLVVLMTLAFADGNLISQALQGLISFSRPSLILVNGLLSVAGPGTWLTCTQMEGSTRIRLLSVLAVAGFVCGACLFDAVFIGAIESVVTTTSFAAITRITGTVTVLMISCLIIGLKIPGGAKAPAGTALAGITFAVVLSVGNARIIGYNQFQMGMMGLFLPLMLTGIIGSISAGVAVVLGSRAPPSLLKGDRLRLGGGCVLSLIAFEIIGLPDSFLTIALFVFVMIVSIAPHHRRLKIRLEEDAAGGAPVEAEGVKAPESGRSSKAELVPVVEGGFPPFSDQTALGCGFDSHRPDLHSRCP